MSAHQLKLHATVPPAPSATRATPARLDSYHGILVYGSGTSVVLRPMTVDVSAVADEKHRVQIRTIHKAAVTAVRFSLNGEWVASGDANGVLCVWSVAKADCPPTLTQPVVQGAVRDIAWTPDGRSVIAVGEGRTVLGACVLAESGDDSGEIKGHTRAIWSCDVVTVGKGSHKYLAVTGGADSIVGFHEGPPFSFKCTARNLHQGSVTCVRCSPDASLVATCSSSPEVVIMDLSNTAGESYTIKTTHVGTIYAVAWSPDGSYLATASADRCVQVHDAKSGTRIRSFCLGKAVTDMQQALCFMNDTQFVSLSLGGALTTLDAFTGSVPQVHLGHQSRVLFLLPARTGPGLVSLSTDGKLLQWPRTGGREEEEQGHAQELPLSCEVASAACASQNGEAIYIIAASELIRQELSKPDSALVISKEATGATAVTVTVDGHVVLAFRSRAVLLGTDGIRCAEVALPNFGTSCTASHGALVALGGDKAVKVFAVATAAGNKSFQNKCELVGQHRAGVSSVCFSADGSRIASGDTAHSIIVWSAADGAVLYNHLSYHTLSVTALQFDPTGSVLLSGSTDCAIIVWHLETGTRKMEDNAHRGGVSTVAWSSHGEIMSAGADRCIRVWRM